MHGVCNLPPLCDLRLVPDPRDVGESAGARRDEGGFGDEQRAWDGGALGVVVCYHGEGDVVVVDAEAGHGGHGDAMRETHAADVEGGE